MRPVNLIPPDERQGDAAPLRTGSLIYVLVGGLALLLLGIVAVALTSKQISDHESEKASLQVELADATAQAQRVQAFTNFRTVQANRAATVTSLTQSRFDWNRVLNELALIVPSDIELNALTGTVTPGVQLSTSGGSSADAHVAMRTDVAGPALEIVGCGPSQDAVAAFVASLEDIDGVTRVGVDSSKTADDTNQGLTGEPGDQALGGSTDCQSGPDVYKFQIVAAFDAVPTPQTATSAPSVPTTQVASSSATAGTGG
jgi:Tfp pilus assembly protein PilN